MNRTLTTPATVTYFTEDGSAKAVDGDYVQIPPTVLTFGPGQTSRSFTVTVGDNPAKVTNRQFLLHLTNAIGDTPGTPADATVLILDRQTPELQLSSFTPPSVALVGKVIAVPNTVRNVSGATAAASTLEFWLSIDSIQDVGDRLLGSRSVPSLGGSASSTATTTLMIPADVDPGQYRLLAVVDATHIVAEQDENNNVGNGPLSVVSNLAKSFAVSGDIIQTGCTSLLRNGHLATQGTLVFSSQTGQVLAGTLTLTEPLVAGWKLSGPVKATIDETGALVGTLTYTMAQGPVIQTGTGAITGSYVVSPLPATLTVDLTGTPTSGETCLVTANLESPVTPIAFLTVQHDAQAGYLGVVDGAFVAVPSFPVVIDQFRALFDVAVDSGFPAPGDVTLAGPSGPGVPAAELVQLATNAGQYRGPFVAGLAPSGPWTVHYKTADFDFTLPDPDAAARLVVPVPTFSVTASGALQQITWLYYNATSGALLASPPAFLQSMRLQVLDPCGLILYDSQALAPSTTSRTLSTAATLSKVAAVLFRFEDDLENLYTIRYGTATPGACRVIEFSAPSYSTSENVSPAAITIRRVGDLSGTVHVHFATSPGSAALADFVDADTDLTFLPGVSTQVVSVTIVNNVALNPSPRTVLLALSGPDGGATIGPLGTAILALNDDEPRLKFSSSTYGVAESKASVAITVQRTGDTSPVVSVHYATSDGTAVAGVDYQSAVGVLDIPAGQTSRTFAIPIINDLVTQGAQTVNLTLSDPIGALLVSPSAAVLSITDNDSGGTLAFSTALSSVAEAGLATIIVTRTGGTGAGVTVHYATSNPGGSTGAVAGPDYDGASGVLTFGANETTKTFTVQTHSVATNKAVALTLSGPSVGASLGSPSSATLWIVAGD